MYIGSIEANTIEDFTKELESQLVKFVGTSATIELGVGFSKEGKIVANIKLRQIAGTREATVGEEFLSAAIKQAVEK